MKKTTLLMAAIFLITASFAQDFIVKKNGEEIKAKVDEIGVSEIKYKKYENLTGPSYTIQKSEVFMIRYENGSKDVITDLSVKNVEKDVKSGNDENEKDFSRFYFKAGGGYGMSLTTCDPSYAITVGTNNVNYVSKSRPLGNGINFGGAFGIFFNKYIGSELGASYLYGDKINITDSYSFGSTSSDLSKYSTDYQAKIFWLKPAIIITPGLKKVNPYASFGVILGFGKIYEYVNEQYFNNSGGLGDVYVGTWEYSGGISFGTVSSLGLKINFGNLFSCFAEIQSISASYSPEHYKMTKITKNGADWLQNFTKHDKEVDFVDSYTDYNTPVNTGNPSKAMRISLPLSSVGMNVGVCLKF